VRQRIEVLRRARSSGSEDRRFVLERVLSAAELADLEGWLGVQLPMEYRTFLTDVGAGGAGPHGGVFPVQRDGQGGRRWVGDGASLTSAHLLARPFPSDRATLDVLNARIGEPPTREDFTDLFDYRSACEAWQDTAIQELWADARTVGAICVAHEGCALRWWLVVTGAARGTMWFDPRVDGADLYGRRGRKPGSTADLRCLVLQLAK
jgi:hypothetical protein